MNITDKKILENALNGDINAFQSLFSKFQPQLKSYLYRLLANRNDADDLTHDTFIKAYDKLASFAGQSSLKTWVFQIATNLAYNFLKKRKRWTVDVKERAKNMVMERPILASKIEHTAHSNVYGKFEIKEHIDTCFTCMAKTLQIENQIALILREIYGFSVKDICSILEKSEGTIKYLLQNARGTMTDIFDHRCALINKNGACNQCSELNGWLNPKQDQQAALTKIKLARESNNYNRDSLYKMRVNLINAIDPLTSKGNELQDLLLKCNQIVMGEIKQD